MKKKQKDDVMGEEESNLPVNDGRQTPVSITEWPNADIVALQFRVDVQPASLGERTSSNYKPGALMSRPPLFTRYRNAPISQSFSRYIDHSASVWHVPNNGESTECTST